MHLPCARPPARLGPSSDPARQAWVSVSDEEPVGWWAESQFSPRAACPQSPGLHYLPAELAPEWGVLP